MTPDDPTPSDALPGGLTGDPALLGAVGEALAAVRKVKSEAKVGMRAELASMTLAGTDVLVAAVKAAEADLRAAGRITTLAYAGADTTEVRDAVLAPVTHDPSAG